MTVTMQSCKIHRMFNIYCCLINRIIVQKGQFRREIRTEKMLALPDSGNNVLVGPKEMFDSINDDIIRPATFEYNRATFKTMPGVTTVSCP